MALLAGSLELLGGAYVVLNVLKYVVLNVLVDYNVLDERTPIVT